MLRRLLASFGLAVWAASTSASAQEPTEDTSSDAPLGESAPEESTSEPPAAEEPRVVEPTEPPVASAPSEAPASVAASVSTNPASPASAKEEAAAAGADAAPDKAKPGEKPEGWSKWDLGFSGYFRAPVALGFSPRPGPDDLVNGPPQMQVSYGPNRTVDANYFSFAYTRLQEQDWVELYVHAKKEHVQATIGWLGYWFQAAGFRNPDAGWVPGIAYLTLDTDFEVAGLKPNIALSGGAWWPRYGRFDKYDTFTLAMYRQIGEQLKLTVPLNADFTVTVEQGFGTGRDGSFAYSVQPPYQATVGLALLHYEHLKIAYQDVADLGLHFNTQWTRDPKLAEEASAAAAYTNVARADMMVLGGEANVTLPYAGHLWVSPSYLEIQNGWALASAGTELMHSLSPAGVAGNYFAWSGSARDSTGSGSMLNLGFLYENTLSRVLGKQRGEFLPEVTLSVFGLLANANLDLPETSTIQQNRITQFKYGAELEVQIWKWLGLMVRWDEVNYDLDHPGYIFSAITPRITFSTDFLSGERIYLQYSRYRYGDNMVLAGRWPWGTPLVAGSDIIQGGPYAGSKPDQDVIKFQADVHF